MRPFTPKIFKGLLRIVNGEKIAAYPGLIQSLFGQSHVANIVFDEQDVDFANHGVSS